MSFRTRNERENFCRRFIKSASLLQKISHYVRNDIFLISVFILSAFNTYAQQYDNRIFQSSIRSIQLYNKAQDQSFPVIVLGSSERLLFSFDDLRPGSRSLTYTIEHCDADWNSSQLAPSEYLQNFTEDRISNYRYSTNTIQRYTHYELSLPNNSIVPKLSGNYILKVYEDGDISKMVLTRRFYVAENSVVIGAEVVSSNNVGLRPTNQKINFQVNCGNLYVQNPNTDVRALVLQNGRMDKAVMNTRPYSTRGNLLLYNDLYTNDFTGGNEFRHFDLRSLKLNSERVGHIYRDTANTVVLLGDPSRNAASYSFQYDNNGNYFVLNQDGRDPRIDADYVHVYFSLAGNRSGNDGTAFIVGKFNDFRLNNQSLMQFDPSKNRFYTDLYLKQGVYDFEYIWVDKATNLADEATFEGSYFETENDYQILVYYRRPGARYEQLVGYRQINSTKK